VPTLCKNRKDSLLGCNGFFSLEWCGEPFSFFRMHVGRVELREQPRSLVVYVDLAGNAHQLWQVKGAAQSWGIASRDGKYLAIPAPTISSNVWMAEGY
jgi:hypothetical protein